MSGPHEFVELKEREESWRAVVEKEQACGLELEVQLDQARQDIGELERQLDGIYSEPR